MNTNKFIYGLVLVLMISSCTQNNTDIQEGSTSPYNSDLWVSYSKEFTEFKIWNPDATAVRLHLYEAGDGGDKLATFELEKDKKSIWRITHQGDLSGKYYTYQVNMDDQWLNETPGIYAQALGVNGRRAMVVDLKKTNPKGWQNDIGPKLEKPNDAIIYEMHVRDFTIHPASGIVNKGKYTGLIEKGAKGENGVVTGLDHLIEMGITHVHLLPSFDFASIDETELDKPQFNWGYDPQNYNVPEGSYSTNPYKAEVRIAEFKQMIQSFHKAKIGVILDVVYNHTGGLINNSNFNLEYPGYYYRHWDDGNLSDAAACGNETASDKEMMRKYIVESVSYWAREYHIDGFRFDLMAIHDIETMNAVTTALRAINPNILIYGEGWTAGDSPLPYERRALKAHTYQMEEVSAFSDDIRDAIKGSVFDDMSTGFVSGAPYTEESVKFGIIGCIDHPQVDMARVNYSDKAWAKNPWQSVQYVSCHDNHTLFDKLSISVPNRESSDIIAMDKLANAVVLTSQGIPFLHAGSEMLRSKQGEHNSYNLPDSINQIDWNLKKTNQDVVTYYKNLIQLRKAHPGFRMASANEVQQNLQFDTIEHGLISYQIKNNANGDKWKNILVVYNARAEEFEYSLEGQWNIAVLGDNFSLSDQAAEHIIIPPVSMLVLYQE
jgi:pullulanase